MLLTGNLPATVRSRANVGIVGAPGGGGGAAGALAAAQATGAVGMVKGMARECASCRRGNFGRGSFSAPDAKGTLRLVCISCHKKITQQ
jgi:hypothetical protein